VTPPIPSGVAAQLQNALDEAALNECERRVVERIVARLREELGDDLLAVWLYGSRAPGEADPDETHHDRRSDIDMMAIVGPARDASAFKWDFTLLLPGGRPRQACPRGRRPGGRGVPVSPRSEEMIDSAATRGRDRPPRARAAALQALHFYV
jgi:hypothetical protein